MRKQIIFGGVVRAIACLGLLAVVLATWGCGGGGNEYGISLYTRSDSCGAAETWALYLDGHKQDELKGTAIYGDPGIAVAVQNDARGIGFNNIGYAYQMDTGLQTKSLRVVPIDIDDNGRIDDWEDFYGTKQELTTAIANGLYPSPPARDLHFVTKHGFTGLTAEFIRWVLTDGQQYVGEAGYVTLSDAKIQEGLDKLGDEGNEDSLTGTIAISGAWALYPMTVKWAEEFGNLHPDVHFDIAAGGAGLGMTQALENQVDIGMVSREIYQSEIAAGAFWVSVTKDAVVPVMNAKNPLLEDILESGVGRQQFVDIWINETLTDWRDVTG